MANGFEGTRPARFGVTQKRFDRGLVGTRTRWLRWRLRHLPGCHHRHPLAVRLGQRWSSGCGRQRRLPLQRERKPRGRRERRPRGSGERGPAPNSSLMDTRNHASWLLCRAPVSGGVGHLRSPMTARLSASTIEIVGSILSGRGTAFQMELQSSGVGVTACPRSPIVVAPPSAASPRPRRRARPLTREGVFSHQRSVRSVWAW
jgi:hypothetical protein